ncbi:MAG: hypothetical protein M3303_05720 [Gemmatimonadota bacterium]|nr:hypothetical protein [Gemmatimonadota bacterium]
MSSSRPTPTIAVVAVPGPGDHEPGASARAVADLLLRVRACDGSRYASFIEHAVRIPANPARVNTRSAPNVAPDLRRSIFGEQHAFLRTQLQYGGIAARDREEDSPDHQLMRAQLAEYRSTGEPYDSVRLEGDRLRQSADGVTDVQSRLHVYELRWAELSRLGSGAMTRPLAELYQLFVHVAHLGRTALDHARLEHSPSALWRTYGAAHTWAVRLLTMFVPAIVLATLATVVAAVLPYRGPGMGIAADRLVVGAWLLAAGGVAYAIFRAYDRLRPGAMAVGVGTYALAATSIALAAARARGSDELLEGTMHVFEVEALLAAGVWYATYLAGALAGLLGLIACARAHGTARRRAWRAARTATATLAVATTSTIAATFVLWAATHRALAGVLPVRPYTPLLPVFGSDGRSYSGFFERVFEVVAGPGVPLLLLVASAVAVGATFVLLPVLVKEVRAPRAGEAFEHHANGRSAPRPDGPIDTDALWTAWESFRREGDASQRLGRRVNRGFRLVGAAVVILYATAFVVAPATSVVVRLTGLPALTALQASSHTIVLVAGGWLVAAAIAVVAFRGRLGRLTLGLRPAVDVVLAVDNYLRTHPRGAAPRARIAERYVSLLRHLCRWRDGNGRPYDAIVIVAQSQGAAITADLLSFVQREEDPELDAIRRPLADGAPGAAGRRLFLFTMGSPLRRLYSEWFPHLFGWVRGDRGDGVARALPAVPREPWMLLPRLEDGHRVAAPAIPDGTAPDPYAMGVTRWVNAYRSGDYVGRAHWRHAVDGCDWTYRCAPADAATRFIGDAPPITYVSEDAHRSRRELCIGAGAHTHYWDATAKAIAVELDLLLTDAAKLAVRVSKDAGARAEGMES